MLEIGPGTGQATRGLLQRAGASWPSSGFFTKPVVHRYVWSRQYIAEEYLGLLYTYSNYIAATTQQRETLFTRICEMIGARPSATVRKHYLTMLQTARRTS